VEVTHNPFNLSIRYRVPVTSARAAEAQITRLMEVKRPRGMRIRHMPDVVKGEMLLQARNTEPVRTVVRVLTDAGLVNGKVVTY